MYAAHFVETHNDQHQRNDDEQYHLIDIGISHGFQSAQHGEEGRDEQQDKGRHPHGNVEHLTNENAACKERQGQPGNDDSNDGVPRQNVAGGLTEAQAHKLRKGVHLCS